MKFKGLIKKILGVNEEFEQRSQALIEIYNQRAKDATKDVAEKKNLSFLRVVSWEIIYDGLLGKNPIVDKYYNRIQKKIGRLLLEGAHYLRRQNA